MAFLDRFRKRRVVEKPKEEELTKLQQVKKDDYASDPDKLEAGREIGHAARVAPSVIKEWRALCNAHGVKPHLRIVEVARFDLQAFEESRFRSQGQQAQQVQGGGVAGDVAALSAVQQLCDMFVKSEVAHADFVRRISEGQVQELQARVNLLKQEEARLQQRLGLKE
jgi:hypothetical protein